MGELRINSTTITLNGTQQTALATLYAKAMESRRRRSVLHDTAAERAIARIDYDFPSLRTVGSDARAAATRSRAYDWWVQRYLERCPECTVLHLGCGLDTRIDRVDPPPSVRWYDIDLPDVITLRRHLFEARPGAHNLDISITDPHLLDDILGDTPVLVVAEGVTPYLRADDGLAMLRLITTHFPAGDLLFDAYSTVGVWILQRYRLVKASGSQLDWSVDDPRDLEREVPGLIFDTEWWYPQIPPVRDSYPRPVRRLIDLTFALTPIRRLARGMHYHFGGPSVLNST